MPLLDHFHPPVNQRRTWESFHRLWAGVLVEKLNRGYWGKSISLKCRFMSAAGLKWMSRH